MDDAVALGRIIRESRLEKGMSLGQLAAAVGRSSSSVRRWERGEVAPAIGIIDELAVAIDVDPQVLRDARPAPVDGSTASVPADTEADHGHAVDEQRKPATVPPVEDDSPSDAAAPAPKPTLSRSGGIWTELVDVVNSTTSSWSGWIRGLLTAAVLIAMLFILIWAVGELLSALKAVWDSFDAGAAGGT